MKATIEFDLNDKDDRIDYFEKFYSQKMSSTLWEIFTLIRQAEKNEYSAQGILDQLRGIFRDIPEELIG